MKTAYLVREELEAGGSSLTDLESYLSISASFRSGVQSSTTWNGICGIEATGLDSRPFKLVTCTCRQLEVARMAG